jgi:hypothetical protein
LVFHTYTHNPQIGYKQPGSSFDGGIGTPFLRGQTWWKHISEWTTYLARLGYMLERGRPVADVLWYLGDEISPKPNQLYSFPQGYEYDYCNPDALLHRLSVKNDRIVTPEGIEYKVLWLNDEDRMLPETLEKILEMVKAGATVIGDAPKGLATMVDLKQSQQRFDAAVKAIWGDAPEKGIRKVGKGRVVMGANLPDALNYLSLLPDVPTADVQWRHRQTEGADWYFVAAPNDGGSFSGEVQFRQSSGSVSLWCPVTGEMTPATASAHGDYTTVSLDLPQAACVFVVFNHNEKYKTPAPAPKHFTTTPLTNPWTVCFPGGWGLPDTLNMPAPKAWKDLDVSPEGKAFSGTATYTTTFNLPDIYKNARYTLDLGKVEMVAVVSLNGEKLRTLWTPPYRLDVTDAIKTGDNTLTVEVTSTWFNRLAYDANLPEADRKTWTTTYPQPNSPLRESGLLGPVTITEMN